MTETLAKEMSIQRDGSSKGVVTIDTERCKGCGFCVEFCPTQVLEMALEFNSHGYHYPVISRPQHCTGCDHCGAYCPDFAIFGTRFKKESARERKSK